MLLALSLKNFVIVEQLNLSFEEGLTVLTGETGAGKSITLDAIGLLLGDKADYSQVRNGAGEAQLSALFDLSSLPELQQELREQGLLDDEATELSVRRVIDAKGKSRSYLNNQAVTLAQLKAVGEQLIDIHGQNAHHSLGRETTQREILDAYAGANELVREVREAYRRHKQAQQAWEDARHNADQLEIERERLAWQQQELAQLNPVRGEWETLNQQHDTLAHTADLLQAAQWAEECIDGDNGLLHQVYQCRKTLDSLSRIEPKFQESLEILASVESELSEVSANMRHVASKAEIDPAELEIQAARIGELMSAARKYRVNPEQLADKWAEINQALQDLEAAADLDELERQCRAAETAYTEKAAQLSAARREAAERLSRETAERMQELSMRGARFQVALLPCAPTANGVEHIEYQVAMNAGSPLRPLHKTASGGELARISLALQVVTSRCTSLPTLIFDEVDTGIGGGVAEIVGRALRQLGEHHQVLVITHLPQVAACGQHHWQVRKHTRDNQTFSEITVLDHAERIEEIARMLGGATLTDTTRRHAAEMLALAEQ